jgi:hypothetical protein
MVMNTIRISKPSSQPMRCVHQEDLVFSFWRNEGKAKRGLKGVKNSY